MSRPHRDDQLRRAVAIEAARIMAEQGVDDFLLAKRKAAERFLIRDQAALPKNAEIEAALREHLRLFQASQHEQQLQDARATALQLMRRMQAFRPRLVGAVLSGSATRHTEIHLHVFADRAAQVSTALLEHGIEHRHAEKRLRYAVDRQVSYPSFKFVAGQQSVEVVVFPVDGLRQAPSSAVDGKAMRRADITEVEQLLRKF